MTRVTIIASLTVLLLSGDSLAEKFSKIGAGTPPAPLVPCAVGQLDFSDGCNTTLYMVLLR